MGINYKKLLNKSKKYTVDKELLKEIEYNEILLIISKELIKYRDDNKLKQEDLAKKLNMSQVMISKMESGKYNHTIKSLVKLWNNLSTNKINFGAQLLKKIYEKVVNNYNTIQVEITSEYDNEEFEYNEKKLKLESTYNIECSIISEMDDDVPYKMAC